ncbi:MAG: N-(5'-phosphoribosyl)anthranilate isomerase [Vicinamibacterales bacterium]
MTAIKLCGFTREPDVDEAAALGIHAAGFVLWSGSPRAVDLATAARLIRRLPPLVTPVGVFVRPSRDEVRAAIERAGVRAVQLHGISATGLEAFMGEGWPIVRATSLGEPGWEATPASVLVLLDAHDPERHGGTGRTIDWQAAGAACRTRRVMLAGGLTPANVGDAIAAARPWGVDVASGIEAAPGVKDRAVMRAFVAAVAAADGNGPASPAGGTGD